VTRTLDVHVVPGSSAAGCLREALHPACATLLVHRDLLSCGPLPRLDSIDEWRRVRQAYLRTLWSDDWASLEQDFEQDLSFQSDTLRAATTITLWIGTGLAEQLLLGWIVELLRLLNVELSALRVVQFHRTSTHSEVVGIGVLDPQALRDHPEPQSLHQHALNELSSAWQAVTAPEPDALLAFLGADADSLPFLRRGLNGLLYRFPDLQRGLNVWELELLRYTREVGPRALRIVGYTMGHDLSIPDWVGDDYLFHRLRRLADTALAHPLVALTGDIRLRTTEAHLTARGHDVLDGRANFVALNGIDDWVGGVHLDSTRGQVWFRADRTLVKAR
jgi:hypothetical protein